MNCNDAMEGVSSAPRDAFDDALMQRIAAGDASAMRVLYARHNVRIFRFALRLVGNRAVAEDVTSEVFVDVWRKPASFAGRCQVSTWLLAVARHKAMTAMRRRTSEPLDDELCNTLSDPSDDPEAVIDNNQKRSI